MLFFGSSYAQGAKCAQDVDPRVRSPPRRAANRAQSPGGEVQAARVQAARVQATGGQNATPPDPAQVAF
jgi:hypothetical protein